MGTARAQDAKAIPERLEQAQATGHRTDHALAAQPGKADRVERDATGWHQAVFHAGLGAEPADTPAAALHLASDGESGEHVPPCSSRHHDEMARFHARPPRMS